MIIKIFLFLTLLIALSVVMPSTVTTSKFYEKSLTAHVLHDDQLDFVGAALTRSDRVFKTYCMIVTTLVVTVHNPLLFQVVVRSRR